MTSASKEVRRDTIDYGDPDLRAAIRGGQASVEALLHRVTDSDYPFVTTTSQHLLEAGGKRLRPLLTLLSAAFGDLTAPEVVPAATVVELTHLATLCHDDVMDEADVRRGADSVNARWGNSVAILTGDFLFARASDLLADLGPAAVRIQAQTFERLVKGQIRETVGPEDGVDAVAHYLYVLAEKTGSLIATAARFGAMFGGVDEVSERTLTRYGEVIGVAFQLADDLLDIAADTAESGKTPGTDLREGVVTLPVLYVLDGADPAEARLRELVSRPITDDGEHAEALLLLRRSPAMSRARSTLDGYAAEAHELVASLPDVPARVALHSVADYIIARDS